jgi:hypothetical protein
MRTVFDHREEGQGRGERAQQRIHRDYSEERIADLIQHRLDIIAQRDRFDGFKQSVKGLVAGYRVLVQQIREIVCRVVPVGGVVMVVSKGDADLIDFDLRTGCHFPETEAGIYAGYHPRDSAAALGSLESSIARGREYLLVPGTALWWLDHYADFRADLDARYPTLWRDRRCVLYDLRTASPQPVNR